MKIRKLNESREITSGLNELYDWDEKRKDGVMDDFAEDVGDFADDFRYNGSTVFDSDYTRARYVSTGDVSLQLRMDGAFQSFSDEQKARMDKELDAFLDALAKNGYKVKGSPKVNDRFFLISNGWGNVYRYVTIRIINDSSKVVDTEAYRDMRSKAEEIIDQYCEGSFWLNGYLVSLRGSEESRDIAGKKLLELGLVKKSDGHYYIPTYYVNGNRR